VQNWPGSALRRMGVSTHRWMFRVNLSDRVIPDTFTAF
jgi:hypothetical protein